MKRFAVLQLSGCSGCEIALLNAEEWIGEYDLAYMNLVMSSHDVPEVEVLLVTGGVRTEEDLYRLRRAVRKADEVIGDADGRCVNLAAPPSLSCFPFRLRVLSRVLQIFINIIISCRHHER